LARVERARGGPEQLSSPFELSQLREGDAAERERGRVVTQGHHAKRAEHVTVGERTGGRVERQIHESI
jgi:hypothetical protein